MCECAISIFVYFQNCFSVSLFGILNLGHFSFGFLFASLFLGGGTERGSVWMWIWQRCAYKWYVRLYFVLLSLAPIFFTLTLANTPIHLYCASAASVNVAATTAATTGRPTESALLTTSVEPVYVCCFFRSLSLSLPFSVFRHFVDSVATASIAWMRVFIWWWCCFFFFFIL